MNPQSLLGLPATSTQKCTLGCPILDQCLGGGIPINSITELVAESASGKTQLCLQLTLTAQLPPSLGGLSASSLYLFSEFPFPARRLHQLSLSFRSLYPKSVTENPCDNVFVQSVHSVDQLFDLIPKIESFVENPRTQLPVRVIVIDSVAALFRSEFENKPSELKKRSSMFFEISGRLKAVARRFDLAVVVTNHVVDCVGEGVGAVRVGNLGRLWSSGRQVCPALGLAWANCVNSRVFLSREEDCLREDCGLVSEKTGRRLHVVFAPHLPYSSCEFRINREGVFGLDR